MKQDGFELSDQSFQNQQHYSDWVFTYPSDLIVLPNADAPDKAYGLDPQRYKNTQYVNGSPTIKDGPSAVAPQNTADWLNGKPLPIQPLLSPEGLQR